MQPLQSSDMPNVPWDFQSLTLTNTHTCLTALCPGLPRWASTRKVKPIWILLEQETVNGSGISWAICKSARTSLQTDNHVSTPPLSFFTGQMPFLPPNQQCQSTECIIHETKKYLIVKHHVCGQTCLAPRDRLLEPYWDGDSVACGAVPQRDDFLWSFRNYNRH